MFRGLNRGAPARTRLDRVSHKEADRRHAQLVVQQLGKNHARVPSADDRDCLVCVHELAESRQLQCRLQVDDAW
eukprot:338953-Pleurochrysis_carterae.AAC.2